MRSPSSFRSSLCSFAVTVRMAFMSKKSWQVIARAFHASCTPDFLLYDSNRELVYRWSTRRQADLRAALYALLDGTEVSPYQKANYGCSIK
jgi:hypothetical protein